MTLTLILRINRPRVASVAVNVTTCDEADSTTVTRLPLWLFLVMYYLISTPLNFRLIFHTQLRRMSAILKWTVGRCTSELMCCSTHSTDDGSTLHVSATVAVGSRDGHATPTPSYSEFRPSSLLCLAATFGCCLKACYSSTGTACNNSGH